MNNATATVPVLLLFLLALCPCVEAQVAATYDLDIPRQPRDLALVDLGRKTGVQVFTLQPSDVLAGPVKGRHTFEAALKVLLATTGATYTRVNEKMYSVEGPVSDSSRRTPDPSSSRSRADEYSRAREEVVVTAMRMQGGDVSAAPVTVLERKSIEELGVSTVQDVLRHIPQQPYVHSEGFRFGGQQYAELRGVGPSATMILIDGRWVPSSAGGEGQAFDLNTIPATAIERVEVLADVVSVIHGAPPGGIINIVLRKDIRQPRVDLQYGTAAGGADERRAAVSSGYSSEKVRTALVVDYFAREPLHGAHRSLWRDQDFRRFGSVDWRLSHGNVFSLLPGNLPGLSPSAADALDNGQGQRAQSLYEYFSVVPDATRAAALANADVRLPGAVAFLEVFYADRATEFQFSPPLLSGMLVPATNAFNSFGAPVGVDFLLTGISPRSTRTRAELMRAVAGLRGRWAAQKWELSFLRSSERAAMWTENELDTATLSSALASGDPSSALNLFEDGAAGNPELPAQMISDSVVSRHASAGTEASASMHGPWFTLPSGDVMGSIGGHWRRETVSLTHVSAETLDRTTSAGFIELGVPLTASLRLTAGGRIDQYSDSGTAINGQSRLTWRPLKSLRVHAAYGTSASPASLRDLYARPRLFVAPLPDARRENEIANVVVRSSSNDDLVATTGASWTFGATLLPDLPWYLRLAVNYWLIRMNYRSGLIPAQLLLAREARYADRVVRREPTQADLVAGLPGTLQLIDLPSINYGPLKTNGMDLNLDQAVDTDIGRFSAHVSATFVHEYTTVELPGEPAVDRVGVASGSGTIPKWRATVNLGWRRGAASLAAHIRHVPAYDDVDAFGRNGRLVPAQSLVDLSATLNLDDFEQPLLRGLEITAGVLNVFDEPPRFAEVGQASGYDTSQGDLKQRFGYVRVSKSF